MSRLRMVLVMFVLIGALMGCNSTDTDSPDQDWDRVETNGDVENTAALCADQTDNDADGLTDCEDDDCAGFSVCIDDEAVKNTEAIEAEIREALDNMTSDTDFTLLMGAQNGHTFSQSIGSSTETTLYESASTSKMVTSAVILHLVSQNILSLEDHPQKYIEGWPDTGNLSNIQLRHLLAFTSGLNSSPSCIGNPYSGLKSCVGEIASENANASTPGTEFYYGPAHMQVAGLMAVNAMGRSTWEGVFNTFKEDTGLFENSRYDLPSRLNPRLAGGMHWIATDYLAFLKSLYEETILSSALIADMTSNQNFGATIVETPVDDFGMDWRYGLGGWIECHEVPFNCTTTGRFNSLGAYGAYPFIDFEHGYYGIIARQGELGTASLGYAIFTAVEPLLNEWAALNQ